MNSIRNSEAVHRADVVAWKDFISQTRMFPTLHSSNNQNVINMYDLNFHKNFFVSSCKETIFLLLLLPERGGMILNDA